MNLFEPPKTIAWFSCGASSAVMAKYFPSDQIAYCETNSEHPDNKRFFYDCQNWFQREIICLHNPEYKDVDDVIDKTNYLSGINGARCTTELKIKVRLAYADVDDTNMIGYTVEERSRAELLVKNFPEYKFSFPLLEKGITKIMCLAIVEAANIILPWMYRAGYNHANRLGCLKSRSKDYWLMIKRDFPEIFWRRARQERRLGYHLIKSCYLDELIGEAGEYNDLTESIVCDGFCQSTLLQLENNI